MGHQCNIPYFTQKMLDGELVFEDYLANKEKAGDILMREAEPIDMVKRYWDYIKNSDAILVINLEKKGIVGYVGGSVLLEMGFAYGFGKTIYFYCPLPERSERIHYLDEIIDMEPVVINGDLAKIKA